jgi:hypothetical protein
MLWNLGKDLNCLEVGCCDCRFDVSSNYTIL